MFRGGLWKMNWLKILIVIGAICLLSLFFFYVIPQLTPSAELRINLRYSEIYQGQEQVLFYKITNNKNEPLEEVVFLVSHGEKSEYDIGTIEDVYRGYVLINETSNLKGKQEVTAGMNYKYKGKNKNTGLLNVIFEVY